VFLPSNWNISAPWTEICTNQHLLRRSAGKGQTVPLSYHYLYPLRTGHVRIRPSEGPRTPLPTLLPPPHARTSPCWSSGRRQTLDRGDYISFRYLLYSYRKFENVSAALSRLLACLFPGLTSPHFSHHPDNAKNCIVPTRITEEYVLLRNASTPADVYD
jgi:hypothetical protein